MKAFVTGATGLLGNNLCRLLKTKGYRIKALVRSPEKAKKWLTDLDLELVQGDMSNVADFAANLKGIDVLFHTAAYFREYYKADRQKHWQNLKTINIDGTRALLEAAEAYKVKKVIHVSSSGTIGSSATGFADENNAADELVRKNLYFKSKLETDEMIQAFLKEHSLAVTSILPAWMFGPYDTAPTAAGQLVLDFARKKLPARFDGGSMMVDARDVAKTMFEAVGLGESGERYLVAGRYYQMSELIQTLERVSQVKAPRLKLPKSLILGLAWTSENLAKLGNKESLLTTDGVKTLMSSQVMSSAKAEKVLHTKFRPLEQTLNDTLLWYQTNGYLST